MVKIHIVVFNFEDECSMFLLACTVFPSLATAGDRQIPSSLTHLLEECLPTSDRTCSRVHGLLAHRSRESTKESTNVPRADLLRIRRGI